MEAKELSNVDIALFALYKLGGDTAPMHTEDVALKCFELLPERFCWKKYPQFPELDPARFGLEDAAKPRYGKLARQVFRNIAGKRQVHWVLTPAGLEHVRARLNVLERLETGSVTRGSERTEENRFIAQIRRHISFKKFFKTGRCDGIEKYEFTDLLRCSLDASPQVLGERLDRLRARVEKAGADDVRRFLALCASHFADMFAE